MWQNHENVTYNYDLNNNNDEIIYQIWENDSWKNFMREIITHEPATDIFSHVTPVSQFILFQNYPNPFNPRTKIRYSITPLQNNAPLHQVNLSIFDILGNKVVTLVNERQNAGLYEIDWNAKNFSSGVYFYQLKIGSYTKFKKLCLIK
jgi:hypothetical protein